MKNSLIGKSSLVGKKLKIAVLISGSGSNLQAIIDACKNPNFPAEIVLTISNRDNIYGLKRAEIANIPTAIISHKDFSSREDFDAQLHDKITQSGANFICLAGFMRLLTAGFVNKWANKMINIHPSLLPDFKGANAHKDVLSAGVKTSGCTVHYVVPEMDSGEIIVQKSVPVYESDNIQTLAARVLEQEHIAYPEALTIIAKKPS